MRINNNLPAMNTQRQLALGTTATAKSMEKLSSGLRINRAGDDAAGLAISEKMRGQIRGLAQASRNAQDGISLVQTAEGALQETQSILQRMRELAVQSANDTNANADRSAIQDEVNQLTQEIDRIAVTTEFNTKKLLNGGAGIQSTSVTETVAGVSANWIIVSGGTSETKTSAVNTTGNIEITAATKATGATTGDITVAATAGAKSITINGTTLSYTATATAATDAATLRDLINANKDQLGVTASGTGATLNITTSSVGSASKLTVIAAAGAITAGVFTAAANTTSGSDATITAADIPATSYVASGNKITITSGESKGLELQLNGSVMSTTAADNAAELKIDANGVLSMQIGANQGQEMSVSVGDMRAGALGVQGVVVSDATSAKTAITTIQSAIDAVSGERAKLGAVQNRLDYSIRNLDTSAENLQAAESRVRDVDIAKEMMTFTKNNILQQAAQAMLAQANQAPQGVLQLLR